MNIQFYFPRWKVHVSSCRLCGTPRQWCPDAVPFSFTLLSLIFSFKREKTMTFIWQHECTSCHLLFSKTLAVVVLGILESSSLQLTFWVFLSYVWPATDQNDWRPTKKTWPETASVGRDNITIDPTAATRGLCCIILLLFGGGRGLDNQRGCFASVECWVLDKYGDNLTTRSLF